MKQSLMSKLQGAMNKDNQKGSKIGDSAGGFHDSGVYEKAKSDDYNDQTHEEDDSGASSQLEQYD